MSAWSLAVSIGKAALKLIPLIRRGRRAIDPPEPDGTPLPWTSLEEQRRQERAAISHKVKR
jgi:hypothetical protein